MAARGEEWKERAKCRGVGADAFHEHRASGGERAAKEFCVGCPVRAECLEFGVECEEGLPDRLLHGVYGGLSPRDRIEVRGLHR